MDQLYKNLPRTANAGAYFVNDGDKTFRFIKVDK